MDALTQVFDAAIDLYTQQDLLEDAIHEYASTRNQAARTMMLRLCDLEDQVVIRATAHDMVPLHNVQYTRDFVISCTFPHLADEDVATIATPYSPASLASGSTPPPTWAHQMNVLHQRGGSPHPTSGCPHPRQSHEGKHLHPDRCMLLERGDYPPRPLTPYPAAHLGTTLAERPMTPIGDSPTGVDENIPPWNWTVNDDFETAHDSASTPLPIVPPPLTTEERRWITHQLLTDSPNPEESVEQHADRYCQQLLTSEPRPSSGGSETGDILSPETEEVVARLTYHCDGTTMFRGVEGS
ncbi:hypothetical protein DAEQUDRAFT_767065 [Daedalea quercina L-15889]|uniref:Uncharacterized protein n=1 Tax=Daedalea quercina L-15889 TaxID=1314783 RepID=A0A165NXX4_9APHY|nr:hypothetical protein DAEQUDRAFT_767065 [Daedalea quercina L-15889]